MKKQTVTVAQVLLVILVAGVSYGAVCFNGAGLSHPDDINASNLTGWDYRPLLVATYAINRLVGAWMLTNLALHMAAAVLVLHLSGSTMAACLFAAHPMAADAVASISGRSSMLCAVFVLASLLALKYRRLVYWALFGLLAFMVKEEAAALFLLTPVALWIWNERKLALISTGAAIIGIALTISVFSPRIALSNEREIRQALHFELHPPQTPRVFASTLGGYALPRIFFPVGLSADPDPQYSPFQEAAGWAAMPILLPLVPYFATTIPFLEHRAYLALAIMAMLVTWLTKNRTLWAVLAIFIILSAERVYVYGSPLRLWEDASEKSPNSAMARVNYSWFLAMDGRWYESEGQLQKAIEVQPSNDAGWQNLESFYWSCYFSTRNPNFIAEASIVADARDAYFNRKVRPQL